jgi:dTDP-4-dehydrorhamnose 3,5-epimerase
MKYKRLETPSWIQALELEVLTDGRGMLIEPIEDADLQRGSVLNLHLATASPGSVRGNHKHPRRTETICIVGGHFIATFCRAESSEQFEIEVPEGKVVSFLVTPGIAHAFKNIGETMGYLLCHADIAFDASDIERFVLVE